jgi:hypothetical protein
LRILRIYWGILFTTRPRSGAFVLVPEIRLRAVRRIGELSRELEKAEFVPRKGACVPNDGKTKEQTLAAAGISTSSAQRYEELAGPREEQAQQARTPAPAQWLMKSEHRLGFRKAL